MALDIYCGSLGRYYAHNWCNIEEQKTKGKEPGIEGERMTELCIKKICNLCKEKFSKKHIDEPKQFKH